MLNRRIAVLCLALTLPAATINASIASQMSNQEINAYLKDAPEAYASADSAEWEDRMYRALKARRGIESTALALAADDHLAAEHEKTLISLWLRNWQLDRSGSVTPQQLQTSREMLRQDILALIKASAHAPLVIEVGVRILMKGTTCDTATFEEIMSPADDGLASGLVAAREAECAPWWLALHSHFPRNLAVIAELSNREADLSLADRLALVERLNWQELHDSGARVSVLQDVVTLLWQAGLIADGIAVVDSASSADRQLLLGEQAVRQEVALDGTVVSLELDDRGKPFERRQRDFRLDYAAALYVTGREEAAGRIFEGLEYTAPLRALPQCFGGAFSERRANSTGPCKDVHSAVGWKWWFLDSALNRKDEDPYLLFEASLGGGLFSSGFDSRSALWVEAVRRRASDANYEGLRHEIALAWAGQQLGPQRMNPATVDRFLDADLQRSAASFQNRINAVAASWNVPSTFEAVANLRRSVSPPPLPQGFREHPLPDELRSTRTAEESEVKWPDGVTPLPQGFFPVRFERGKPYTVAISLSQNLDPVGEVSAGAYWIHLSRDGGLSWEQPLYTGLSEYFPYIILPSSKMPLISDDRITVETSVQELDPATITYPPVLLGSRRRAADLYLEIPLDALKSDRDHDGLTDIVEDHLLLNPEDPDSDGDGVPDGRDPLPNVRNSVPPDAVGYMQQILETIFRLPSGAILEPVDRPNGTDSMFMAKRAEEPGPAHPLFLAGRGEDFAGVRLPVPVFVYSNAELEKLGTRNVDFHATWLGEIVFNRKHDRGYLQWSQGWTGGSLRLIREGTAWKGEELSRWIT